jgi:hypothetical protein
MIKLSDFILSPEPRKRRASLPFCRKMDSSREETSLLSSGRRTLCFKKRISGFASARNLCQCTGHRFKMQPIHHAGYVVETAQRIVCLVCASLSGTGCDDHPLAQ